MNVRISNHTITPMLKHIFISGLLVLSLAGSLYTAEYPPQWVLDGILYTETHSTYRENGTIRYVDMRRGSHGEYGPFQMTQAAFKQVRKRGDAFWKLETDTAYAEKMTVRYLQWLDKHYGHGDWKRNVEMYNAGPGSHSVTYLQQVLQYGRP